MTSTPTSVPTGPLPPAGLLDELAIERLRTLDPLGTAGLLERVLKTYTASLQRLVEQLRVARRTADLQAQRHVAHTLKSSSASVGALKLSALCAEIERRMRDDPPAATDSLFDALISEAEHLLAHLRQ